jgi:hypothetical protein
MKKFGTAYWRLPNGCSASPTAGSRLFCQRIFIYDGVPFQELQGLEPFRPAILYYEYSGQPFNFGWMIKRLAIFLTCLAYALTLAHSATPHHHHEDEAGVDDRHEHHHDKGHDDHHHDDEGKTEHFVHFFSDAVHHPGSKVVLHPPIVDHTKKFQDNLALVINAASIVVRPQLRPPDNPCYNSSCHHSSDLFKISLLRAPPVA